MDLLNNLGMGTFKAMELDILSIGKELKDT